MRRRAISLAFTAKKWSENQLPRPSWWRNASVFIASCRADAGKSGRRYRFSPPFPKKQENLSLACHSGDGDSMDCL